MLLAMVLFKHATLVLKLAVLSVLVRVERLIGSEESFCDADGDAAHIGSLDCRCLQCAQHYKWIF